MHRFERSTCIQCGDSSFINAQLCWDCKNTNNMSAMLESIAFKQLFRKRQLPETLAKPLVEYLLPMHNASAEFRRKYLWKMLCWSGSRFRLLTFGSNGKAGSISAKEDIIDRVLQFLCGKELPDNQEGIYWTVDTASNGQVPFIFKINFTLGVDTSVSILYNVFIS